MSSAGSIRVVALLPFVALGGTVGAAFRALTEELVRGVGGDAGSSLLLVNLSGAFLLGLVFVRLGPDGRSVEVDRPLSEIGGRERLLAFSAVGCLGAFTTYSGVVDWLGADGVSGIDVSMALELTVMLLLGPLMVVFGMACGRRRSTST